MSAENKNKPSLSVVIPARNEELSLPETISSISKVLKNEHIDHEIIVVDDHSNDATLQVVRNISHLCNEVRITSNTGQGGFGSTVVFGLNLAQGTYIAIMMADQSDDPQDLVRFYKTALETKSDCVFGNRFVDGGSVENYPKTKFLLNRFINNLVRILFFVPYNDFTNAFKLYKRETIEGLKPILSNQFNLTLELPLKAVIRGYSYSVVPNSWKNRKFGQSSLKIHEMGSRYLFIMLYCLIERFFSRGDYLKTRHEK